MTTTQSEAKLAADAAKRTDVPAPAPARTTRTRKTTAASKTTKSAPAKQTKSAPAKVAKVPAGPSDRAIKQSIDQILTDMGAAWFAALPARTVKGKREVQIGENWVDRDHALMCAKQVYGYTSHAITWPAKVFGARDVGRPAPKSAKAA